MPRNYAIESNPEELGGGWRLRLFENMRECASRIFPVYSEEPHVSITWWNAIAEERRAHWVMMAGSTVPATVRHVFLLAEAYDDAKLEADLWLAI